METCNEQSVNQWKDCGFEMNQYFWSRWTMATTKVYILPNTEMLVLCTHIRRETDRWKMDGWRSTGVNLRQGFLFYLLGCKNASRVQGMTKSAHSDLVTSRWLTESTAKPYETTGVSEWHIRLLLSLQYGERIFLTAKPLWAQTRCCVKNALRNIYDYQRMGPGAQLLFRVQLRRGEVTSAWLLRFSLSLYRSDFLLCVYKEDKQYNTHFRGQ